MYTPLPLFHGNALLVSMLGSMLLDAKFALGERFTASRFWDDCRRYDAVEFNTLGGMISILLKQPPSPTTPTTRCAPCCRRRLPPDRWREFEERFGVQDRRVVYGMVDSPGFLLNADGKVGSMGKPIADIDFAVVDDDGQPSPARPGRRDLLPPPPRAADPLPQAPRGHRRGLPRAAGSTPATSASSTTRAGCTTRAARRSRCAASARTSPPGRSRRSSTSTPTCWSAAPTPSAPSSGEDEVKVAIVRQPDAVADPEDRSSTSARARWPTTPSPATSSSSRPCRRRRPTASSTPPSRRGITQNTWDREAVGYKVSRA